MKIRPTTLRTLLPLMATCLCADPSLSQPLYSIVPIPPPPDSGGFVSGPRGINDHGQVVGSYTVLLGDGTQVERSFLFDDGTGSVDALPQAMSAVAEGINNNGQIALHGGDSFRTVQAYRFTPGVGFEPLGSFGGALTEVEAINASGQVTGFSETSDGQDIAFRYTDGIGIESLGTLFGGSSVGVAINDLGWVAGASGGHAFLFTDELGMVDLGVGAAFGINNNGYVVGRLSLDGRSLDSFIYHDGIMNVLIGTPFGSDILADINEQNVALGVGLANGNQTRALRWTESDGLIDLNSLVPEESGWTLITASEINELGQISGQGLFNGSPLAYRLDPFVVPEPATWTIFGLAGLICWLWRPNRRAGG